MSDQSKTLNDKAWEQLFTKYNILERIELEGRFEITAKQINEFREARLMTKFDHRSNLPILFYRNKLSILPITRGSYIIAKFEAYHDFESPISEVTRISAPDYIHSIDFQNITSEATAINVAYLSGIISDFTEDKKILPTVNGRMSSDSFDFHIYNKEFSNSYNIDVNNSQIEIDGGFEGFNSLILVEAKNFISDDFLIRQLYYPFRTWANKIGKTVRPIYLTYSNGIFSLYEYFFTDTKIYNSLKLAKQKRYTLIMDKIQISEIISIAKQVKILNEPDGIPFPQADSFERVVNICELLYENNQLSREEITLKYDFNVRQTNYYIDACRYLGLVGKDNNDGISYRLTDKGKKLFKMTIKNRNLEFVRFILEKEVFNKAFLSYLESSELPPKSEIVKFMEETPLYNINSEVTYYRRASTISSWIKWIVDLSK